MAAKIRLARVGGHKNPYYRIVVADESRARDGKFLEILGTFAPVHKGKEVETKLNMERIESWLKTGATPSETVAQIFARYKKTLADAPKA
jgi:small subunit ribosomal protein S16